MLHVNFHYSTVAQPLSSLVQHVFRQAQTVTKWKTGHREVEL